MLLLIAQRIKACCSEAMTLCRWGGDEFMVIMPKSTVETAMALAERIRQAVLDIPPVGDFKVTLSLGVVQRLDHESPTNLMARADQALYRSKAAGKDRVSQ